MSKIFYAEDNEDFRELYSFIMEAELGYEVVEFPNGQQLVDQLKSDESEVPDFVVSDFDMPGGNGDVVFHHLNDEGFKIPLVFLSSQVVDQIPGLGEFKTLNKRNRLILKPATNDEVVGTLKELNCEDAAEGHQCLSLSFIQANG